MTTASRLTGARTLIVTAALLSLTGLACTSGGPQDAAAAAGPDRGSSAVARLTDRVPTPVLHWTTCRKTAQCATAELPLDYNQPHGPAIKLALLRLTYFGESYGSYLGLVYANMFPDRVRAIAIDGIVDPRALAGTPATADVPVFDRMGSAAASYRALHDLLELCQRAGRPRCSFAGADNHLEAQSGVLCADGLHAADAASWPAAAAAADRRAPYFGAYYAWVTVQCARSTWTARDENVYRGPFGRRTAAPVLVIGNLWDPVTNYDNAVKVARLLPGSRLVSSDSWGHEAVGTSACVDTTVWAYLIRPLAPAPKITRCRGDVQPFAPSPSTP